MRYRIMVHVDVEARNIDEAKSDAVKLGQLLKQPLVRIAIEGEGIRLANGDGQPVVYNPQPAL